MHNCATYARLNWRNKRNKWSKCRIYFDTPKILFTTFAITRTTNSNFIVLQLVKGGKTIFLPQLNVLPTFRPHKSIVFASPSRENFSASNELRHIQCLPSFSSRYISMMKNILWKFYAHKNSIFQVVTQTKTMSFARIWTASHAAPQLTIKTFEVWKENNRIVVSILIQIVVDTRHRENSRP